MRYTCRSKDRPWHAWCDGDCAPKGLPTDRDVRAPKTLGEMCQAILDSPDCPPALKAKWPTAIDLFNYSKTGELFMIWEWYDLFVTKNPWVIGLDG